MKPARSTVRSALTLERNRLAVAVGLAAAAFAGVGVAQTRGTDMVMDAARPRSELGFSLLTPGQPSELPTWVPQTVESIGRTEIERNVNGFDPEDALRYFPGVDLRKRFRGDYLGSTVGSRTAGADQSNRTLIYADGVQLTYPFANGINQSPRWRFVSLEEIDRVDVLYGPFSAQYSGNSIGNVINFTTRVPKGFETQRKVGGFFEPFKLFGTNETLTGTEVNASIGSVYEPVTWWVLLNRINAEGQPTNFATRPVGLSGAGGVPVSGGIASTDRFGRPVDVLGSIGRYRTEQTSAKLKLALDLPYSATLAYTGALWRNDGESNVNSYLRDAAGTTVYSGPINVNGHGYTLQGSDFSPLRDDQIHYTNTLRLMQSFGDVFQWELFGSLYTVQRDFARRPLASNVLPAGDSGGMGVVSDIKGAGWHTIGFKALYQPGGDKGINTFEFGILEEFNHVSALTQLVQANWIEGTTGEFLSRAGGATQLRSVYGQDTWRLASDWRAILGLRLETFRGIDGAYVASNPSGLNVGACSVARATCELRFDERSESAISPKGAVSYQFSESGVVKLAYGRAVRYPTVAELFSGQVDNTTGSTVYPNPGLRYERVHAFELGVQWTLPQESRFRVTGFRETTRDAVYLQSVSGANMSTYQNVNKVRANGLEMVFSGGSLSRDGIAASVNLTYTRASVLDNAGFIDVAGDTVDKQLPRVPRLRGNAQVTWQPLESLSLSYGAKFNTRQYTTLNNSDTNSNAPLGASSSFTSDVRLFWQATRRWSFSVGVDNVNNARDWNESPLSQRTYLAEVKFDVR